MDPILYFTKAFLQWV